MRYSHFLSWAAGGVLFLLGITDGTAEAPTPPTFTLDAAANAAQDLSLTVAAPTTLPFKIIRGGGPVPAGFTIDVSSFTNAEGFTVPVSVSVGNDPDTGATHLDPAAFAKPILAVTLHVKAFPAPGKYIGRLIIATPGTPGQPAKDAVPEVSATPAQSTIWRLTLDSAGDVRPATLVIDQNIATLTGARAFCLFSVKFWKFWDGCFYKDDEPVVEVHVRDKTGTWPLAGVVARLESGLKAPGDGINWASQLVATLKGPSANPSAKPVEVDLFATPALAGPARTLAPHEQGIVTLTFKKLVPGDYTIPLRFTAANSGEDDLQKLTITMKVRESLVPAVLVLFFAALFSFMATRIVSTLRQRAAFLARARALRPGWLADERPILPVIWVRATLRLVETLSDRFFWLTGQSELDARLTAVAAMVSVLERVRQVRSRIEAEIPEPMVQDRAIWKLDDRIISQLGAAPLTEQDVARFKTELDRLADWCDPGKKEKSYWDDVLPVIQAKCTEVELSLDAKGQDPNWQPGKLARELIAKLAEARKPEPALPGLIQKMDAEADFERLSILWEAYSRGHDEQWKNLVSLGANAQLDKVKRVIDDHWWEDLKKPEVKPSIEAPASPLDPREAYEAVTFRVETPGMPFLRNTYLMQKKLTYHWAITVYDARFWRQPREIGTLRVVSSEPQVAQYSPVRGRMEAKVKIAYEGQEGPGFKEGEEVRTKDAVKMVESTDFGIFAKYEMADLIAFGLAATASIASGVALYALKPEFIGSLQDYLTLFTWGASLDQGKNFLQSLGAYAGTTSKPAVLGGQ